MANFSSNLKYLRKAKGLTQQQMADHLKVKRASIGAYEEDRAEPKYELLKKIADYFELTMDELIYDKIDADWEPTPRSSATNLRVLSITLDENDKENVEFVPVKASAGYLNGYADPEYVKDLIRLRLPMFSQGTFRAFEIKGDSMLPLPTGTVIIGEYVENWHDIKVNQTYIIVSKNDGIVYKRIGQKFKDDKGLRLVSDNKTYESYWVDSADIIEVWKAKAFLSTQMPEAPSSEPTLEGLSAMMAQMQKTIYNAIDKK